MKLFYMQKILFIIFLLCVLSSAIWGQEAQTITVLPFLASDVPTYLPLVVGKIIEGSLEKTAAFNVVSQDDIKNLLGEDYNDYLGCEDPVCAIEIGEKIGAKQIIAGTVSLLDGKYVIESVIIDVETAKIIYSETENVESIKDLNKACEKLAVNLAQNANPDLVIEIPDSEKRTHVDAMTMEVEEDKTAETDTTGNDETDVSGTTTMNMDTENGGDSAIEEEVLVTLKFNVPAYLFYTSGHLSNTAGNIVQNIALQIQMAANDAYNEYISAGVDAADIYSSTETGYESLYNLYLNSTYLYYGLWAGGGLVTGISNGFLSNSHLSLGGKILKTSGVLINTAGNVANAISVIQLLKVRSTYIDYMKDDGTSTSELYKLYNDNYVLYNLEKIIGYSLWGGGTLLDITSYLLPGKKSYSRPGFLEQLLSGLGYLMLSAGNYSFSIGTNKLLTADQTFSNYMAADEFSVGSIYNEYVSNLREYEIYSYVSYGLWTAGTVALISSLFIPEKSVTVEVAETPYDISIRPALLGLGVNVGIQWK
jgi:hypothetical protein